MTLFWTITAAMIAVALAILARTLLREHARRSDNNEAFNVEIAREHLAELVKQKDAGELSDEEFAQARKDLEIALAQDLEGENGPRNTTAGRSGGRWALLVSALLIPLVSVIGVGLGGYLKLRDARRLQAQGHSWQQAWHLVHGQVEKTEPNWFILIGSLVFVAFTISIGLSELPFREEIIFTGSMAIVLFLMVRLLKVLDDDARRILVGTAIIIFVYRAMPSTGAGETWWMNDVLKFDQQFFSILSLVAGGLALFGMFIFRRFMAEKSIAYIIGFLTIIGGLLFLPNIGMYYGVHEWTGAHTNDVVDARFIAVVSTAVESPLQQVAMIPMLAWIANSAPAHLKATFFAVMASFTNLALSLGQLGTKYVNQVYEVTREVKDSVTGAIKTPADYSELGLLFITVAVLSVSLPLLAIYIVKKTPLRCA